MGLLIPLARVLISPFRLLISLIWGVVSLILWVRFTNRGVKLFVKYKQDGNTTNLTEAIDNLQNALALCPAGHPTQSRSLNDLALAILTQYEQGGNLADLTRAIEHYEEALNLRPPGDSDRSTSLNDLACAIVTRYEREGNSADLTYALELYEEALELRPPGHPGRSMFLNNLAGTLSSRYQREGNLDDIIRAIEYYEEALDLRPTGHPDRSASLNNLAYAMQVLYGKEGNLDDLTRAIQYHEQALNLLPSGHPDRSQFLNNLATGMHTRYKEKKNLNDLTRAIQCFEEALDLRPPGHPDRPTSLNNLACAIQLRYHREGSLDDLSRVMQYQEEMLHIFPPGNPYRSTALLNRARALHAQYYKNESVGDSTNSGSLGLREGISEPLEGGNRSYAKGDSRGSARLRIISLLREASQTSCSPRDGLQAALDWVKISKDLAPNSTLDAYTSALGQLDAALAVARSLNQRQNRLLSDEVFENAMDLDVDAATWALQHDNLERAVELLEQGRSLLFAQIGRYRVELDDLRLANPELADRFAHLSQLLDASVVSNRKLEDASLTVKDPYERYRKVSTEWTRVVEEIRGWYGFETFLKPTPYEQLRLAAVDGPIIILVPSEAGTVALIICNNAPIHRIDLPRATSNRLAELSGSFTRALNCKDYNDTQRERECVDNLASLWNEVVRPIAEALQHDLAIPLRSRVWWCPASVACFLPLHAAGLYAKAKAGENFPNKYTSSYTPTLGALIRARRTHSSAPTKLLVISQPDTPGEPPLPFAQVEADAIAKIVSSIGTTPLTTMTPLLSEAGTREAAQNEMASHPWVHFICHGVQKANEPLESYLSLYDGPLTLREIIEQNLPNADFVFLAACHSAAGDKALANEALHPAAAMQFAGFRGVVGTLWKMRDVDGPPLAEAFYKDMIKHGDHRRAAVALSKAINHLRRDKVPIHCWMRFIHIGA